MLLNTISAEPAAAQRWGADSSYGRLRRVLLSPPPVHDDWHHSAEAEHRALREALADEGVEVELAPSWSERADMPFTRDPLLMSPWGLIELAMQAPARRGEEQRLREHVESLGVPIAGRVAQGHVEGGDASVVRPGLLVVGWSGERTTLEGAKSLARMFEAHGWRAYFHHFDEQHLHLDLLFTVIGKDEAVACKALLGPEFCAKMESYGISLIDVTPEEKEGFGCNLLGLGDKRVISVAGHERLNGELRRRGYRVIERQVSAFTANRGAVHCMTCELARDPG
ncbi:MAG TPA: arginine deiminase family protein [Allosphingosinicella sp.]|jgi:N-dimethylarginine dimethylaminohydrolase